MDCLRIPYLVLTGLLSFLVVEAEALHEGVVTGPNVCGKPYNTHCCDGWELHPTLRKCFVPVCRQDCGEGYCHRPNLCSCPNGVLSSIGCEPSQENMVHVVLRAISDGPCNPPCRNGGHCGNGGRCVCPYGFMGMDCSVDYRTGPCYRRLRSGTCSDPVTGLRSTKALCCATLGDAWGNSCEECSGMSTCPRGYMRDYRTDECLDVDECLVIPGICETETGVCENTRGSFKCHDKGKPLSFGSFGRTMGVREEQDYRTGPCYRSFSNGACSTPVEGLRSSKALCCATLGQAWGNSCEQCDTSQCQQGFIYDVSTGDCLDVDECIVIPGLCESGTGMCQNTVGSFRCQDKGIPLSFNGTRNDAGMLEQGDETGPCFLHVNVGTCSYPVAGFAATKEVCCGTVGKGWGSSCEPCASFPLQCQPGMSVDEVTGLCVDVNECELLPELCQGGTCQNTQGSFICQAKGRPLGSATGNLGPCFLVENSGSCSFAVAGFTATKEICCGTVGQAWGLSCESCSTFRSQCMPGFSLNEVTRRCIDVNECELLPELCQLGTCQNTQGGFTCQAKGQPLMFLVTDQDQANGRPISAQETIEIGLDSFQLLQVHSDGSVQDVKIKLSVGVPSNGSKEMAEDFKTKIQDLAHDKDIASLEEFGIDICKTIFDFYSQVQNCQVNIQQEPWREQSRQRGQSSYFHCTKYIRSADVAFGSRNGPVEVSGSLSNFKILKTSQHSDQESPSEHSSHTVSSTKLAVRCVFRNGQDNDYQQTWTTVISTISDIFSGTLDNETLPTSQSDTEIARLIAHTILEKAPTVFEIAIDMTTVDYAPINSQSSDTGSIRKVLTSSNELSRTTSVVLQRNQ